MLAFLHTATSHVELFSNLVQHFDPTIDTRHEVREDLLLATLAAGAVTDAVTRGIEGAVAQLAREGARVIVCTCSTLGAAVEAAPISGVITMRVDRALAERALTFQRRLVVVATINTALKAAVDLLRAIAPNPTLEIVELLCEAAWTHFQSGDDAAYAREIACQIEERARPGDVVMLAQASMSKAAALISLPAVEILASPPIGVLAALRAYHAQPLIRPAPVSDD